MFTDKENIEFSDKYFLKNTFGDRYLYSINHNTLNKFGAFYLHQNKFSSFTVKENSFIIIIGSDSGTIFKYLSEISLKFGTKILVIEPNSIYTKIVCAYDSILKKNNIYFSSLENFEKIIRELEIEKYYYAGDVFIVKSLAAEYAFIAEYHECSLEVQNYCQQLQWFITSKTKKQPFVHAQLANIADNTTPSSFLQGLFAGKTAILLAGGPSLDKLLPWVTAHQEKITILATSRICRRLLTAGLYPDFLFTIDPHQVSFDVSVEMLHFWKHSTLIYSYHANPRLIGQWQGSKIFLGHRFPWETKLNVPSLPLYGPTVSNTALSVATEMGFKRIFLAGLDLCHSREGYTHASGSNEHQAGPQLSVSTRQVTTNGGGVAETSNDFYAAIHTIQLQAEEANRRSVEFINLSANSAKIKNVSFQKAEDVTFSELKLDTEAIIINNKKQNKNIIKDLQICIQEIKNIQKDLSKIQSLTGKALKYNKLLFGSKPDFKYKLQMDSIEETLNSKYKNSSIFVKRYATHNLLKMTLLGDKETEWSDEQLKKSANIYYKNYRDSAKVLYKLLNTCKKNIDFRIKEQKDISFFPEISEHWQNSLQPGRYFIWKSNKNIDKDFLEIHQKTINIIETLYDNQFKKEKSSPHMSRSLQLASLNGIISKIIIFYNNKNLDLLRGVKESLHDHKEKDAIFYYNLCCGYICELEDDLENAAYHYQKTFDSDNENIIENALQRIAHISLKREDLENSELALKMLTNFSPSYLIQYADFLKIIGKNKLSINIYLDYIEKFPKDTAIMIKLAIMLNDLNMKSGAKDIMNHILTVDPDNISAKKYLAIE